MIRPWNIQISKFFIISWRIIKEMATQFKKTFETDNKVDRVVYQNTPYKGFNRPLPPGTIQTSHLNRPSFKVGDKFQYTEGDNDITKINQRNGNGNYTIQRDNFQQSTIAPRVGVDFDQLKAIELQLDGAKVQLSDKTIDELFKAKLPDPTDTTWLNEKRRLVAMYQALGMSQQDIEKTIKTNAPLGREQRTVSSSIGYSVLSVSDKIDEIKKEVLDGRAESKQNQAILIGQLALIFTNIQTIDDFTKNDITNILKAMGRLNVPQTHLKMGLPRFIDNKYYKKESGLINLFLFSNVSTDPTFEQKDGISYAKPLYNLTPNNTTTTYNYRSMVTVFAKKSPVDRYYLDTERRGLIDFKQLVVFVTTLQGGLSNPAMSGLLDTDVLTQIQNTLSVLFKKTP
jgi:hypothetical protein